MFHPLKFTSFVYPSKELSLRQRNGKGVSDLGVRLGFAVYNRPRMAHPGSDSSTSSSESKDDCAQASTLCQVGLLLMVFGPKIIFTLFTDIRLLQPQY